MKKTFSHLNAQHDPSMVAVDAKAVTTRSATAEAWIDLPLAVCSALDMRDPERPSGPKGAIFQTAMLAGIMAAKQTGQLIPLCHVIPLEHCQVDLAFDGPQSVRIRCTARATHKTGVEMEALTGATLAALTVYDMCKGLSHDITIRQIRLLEKTGGKTDVCHD